MRRRINKATPSKKTAGPAHLNFVRGLGPSRKARERQQYPSIAIDWSTPRKFARAPHPPSRGDLSDHGDGRRRPPLLRRTPASAPRPGSVIGSVRCFPAHRRGGAAHAPDRRAIRYSSPRPFDSTDLPGWFLVRILRGGILLDMVALITREIKIRGWC